MLQLGPGDEVNVDGEGVGVVEAIRDINDLRVLEVRIDTRIVFVVAEAAASTARDALRRLRA